MKMAMGCRWAACSRRTALAETSRMQCFPWGPAGGGKGHSTQKGRGRRLAEGEVTDVKGHGGKRRETGMDRVTNSAEKEGGAPSTGGQGRAEQRGDRQREAPKEVVRGQARAGVERQQRKG